MTDFSVFNEYRPTSAQKTALVNLATGTLAGPLTVTGGSDPTLGDELTINGTFETADNWTLGTGWAFDDVNLKAQHTAGNTATLAQALAATANSVYKITTTMSGRTAGDVTVAFGGVSAPAAISATATQYIRATSTGTLAITPSTTFDGAIDSISIKQVIPSSPINTMKASDGSVAQETRASLGTSSTLVGVGAGRVNVSGTATILGHQAGYYNCDGLMTAVGYQAGYSNVSGSVVAVGNSAAKACVSGNVTAVGYQAAKSATSSATALGYLAATATTTGSATCIGSSAGASNTTGVITAVGDRCGYTNTTGAFVGVGQQTGFYNSTGEFCGVGLSAGRNSSTGSTTALGHYSGYSFTGAGNITAIGSSAGYSCTGSGSLFIGYQAGYNETAGNKLYISNSNTATPLILGDFGTGLVTIHNDLKANTKFGLGLEPIATRAHVADPADGTTVDAEARTAINSILATLEAFGFHAAA